MNKFDQAFKKYIVEDAEERAWEYRQIQDAAKKAKAMKKKGQKVNFNQLADDYGVSTKDIKKACNESYIEPKAASKRAFVINLEYGNEEFSEVIPSSEIAEATEGLEPIKAKNGLTIYRGETYVVVVMGN